MPLWVPSNQYGNISVKSKIGLYRCLVTNMTSSMGRHHFKFFIYSFREPVWMDNVTINRLIEYIVFSLGFWLQNTQSEFQTLLPEPIELKEDWEVRLADIQYLSSWYNIPCWKICTYWWSEDGYQWRLLPFISRCIWYIK